MNLYAQNTYGQQTLQPISIPAPRAQLQWHWQLHWDEPKIKLNFCTDKLLFDQKLLVAQHKITKRPYEHRFHSVDIRSAICTRAYQQNSMLVVWIVCDMCMCMQLCLLYFDNICVSFTMYTIHTSRACSHFDWCTFSRACLLPNSSASTEYNR